MFRLTQAAVLAVGLLSLFGMASASASAVTWDNSGSTAFTATSGARTISATAAAIACSGATATGDAPTGGTAGAVYAVRGTLSLSGCILANIALGIECAYTVTATSQSGSVTSGSADMTCGWYEFGQKICHVGGSLSVTYTNPVSGVGSLTLATGGNLTVTNPASGTCPVGNGDRVHYSELTFRTTSPTPPVITRTT